MKEGERRDRFYRPPEGWMRESMLCHLLGDKLKTAVTERINALSEARPAWQRTYSYRGSDRFFYSPDLTKRLIREFFIPAPKRKKYHGDPETAKLEAQVKELRSQGKGQVEISQILDQPIIRIRNLVHRLLTRTEVANLPVGKNAEARIKEYLAEHRAQFGNDIPVSQAEIARALGDVTREGVRKVLNQLAQTEDLPPFNKHKRRRNLEEFDKEVGRLKDQGLKEKEVARQLGARLIEVRESCKRINTLEKAEVKNIQEDILRLRREQRLGNQEIAEQLSLPVYRVTWALKQFTRDDLGLRLRKKRRTSAEMEQFSQDVKRLRLEGLSRSEIATALNVSPYSVTNMANQLIASGDIPRIDRSSYRLGQGASIIESP